MTQDVGVKLPNSIGNFISKRGTGIIMLVILLMLGFRATLFFAPSNLMNVLKQGGILTLVALGLTMVLVSGGFDMGAGMLVQFSCNLAAGAILDDFNPIITLLIGLLVGLLTGLLNAFLVITVKIPTFVATLGTMFVLQGLTTLYNKGLQLVINPQPVFSFWGQGRIGPVPVIFLIVLCLCVLMNYFLKRTQTGLRMYATGENPQAASLRGINTNKYLMIGYLLSGAILGVTGVLQCSYNYGATAAVSGIDFLIQALAAAYLGSTFSRTSELSVIGTFISGMYIAALSNVLIINGISNRLIPGILGVILIVSILVTTIRKREIGQVTMF